MTRREFVLVGSAGLISLGGCRGTFFNGARINLAMAGYTLHRFKADAALDFCEKHGFHYLCVKDFHLPYESSSQQRKDFRNKCSDHGVTPYAIGPTSIRTEDEARKCFEYAMEIGAGIVVGIPTKRTGPNSSIESNDVAMCEVCSRLADEYRLRFAIHNHGRNPKTGNPNLYPAVPETYAILKDLSPRMGLCVDWAYTYADGLDCVEMVRLYGDRIFDGHVRCISDAKNGSSGINPKNRVFEYDAIFDALRKHGYDGCLGLELANAFPDNPQWIDESRDYFEGLM